MGFSSWIGDAWDYVVDNTYTSDPLSRLSANQTMWRNTLAGRDPTSTADEDDGFWTRFGGGVIGFATFAASPMLVTNPTLGGRVNTLLDEVEESNPEVYTAAVLQLMTQSLRDAVYLLGWLAGTAPATLVLPFLNSLNAKITSMDPLLRPPVTGYTIRFNPLDSVGILEGYPIVFDPLEIRLLSGSPSLFDPLMTPVATVTIEAFNVIVMVGE